MVYFDINLRVEEGADVQNPAVAAKLKELVLSSYKDGYSYVGVTIDKQGIMSEKDICQIPKLQMSKDASAKLSTKHEQNIEINQLSRINFHLKDQKQVHQFTSQAKIFDTYDIISVTPYTEKLFEAACSTINCDLISLNMNEKLPFFLKKPIINMGIEKGVFFEISYSEMIKDSSKRRYFLQNAMNLVTISKGRNIIISSGADDSIFQRSPIDLMNFAIMIGMNKEMAYRSLSTNCESLYKRCRMRKTFKGVVDVLSKEEAMALKSKKGDIEETKEEYPKMTDEEDQIILR